MSYENSSRTAVAFKTPRLVLGDGRTLEDVNVEFASGGIHLLRGANGSGKTTLLYALAGLLSPYQSAVTWWGESVDDLTVAQRARRRSILFQKMDAVPPWTAEEYVAVALPSRSRSERMLHAMSALQRLDVAELAGQHITTLSGGELARVRMAQALVSNAPLLLLDEPDAALDDPGRQALWSMVVDVVQGEGRTCVVISHDASMLEHTVSSVTTVQGNRVIQVR